MNKGLRATQRMARVHSKGNVVIDLGAHVSYASIAFSHAVKEVHVFEAKPLNFWELLANVRPFPNIVSCQKSVSSQNGMTKLFFENAQAAGVLNKLDCTWP